MELEMDQSPWMGYLAVMLRALHRTNHSLDLVLMHRTASKIIIV